MPIDAILEPPQPENLRDAKRLQIRIEASGQLEEGNEARVVIHNLSASGILIETQAELTVGQKIKLALPETTPVSATVVWQSGHLYGCRFDHIISRAVLSAAQLCNPLPSPIDPVFPASTSADNEPLAARIFRLRRARGLSRAEVAARTGLSKPSIWSWETGKAIPRHSNISLLAGALDISEDELLTGHVLDHVDSDTPECSERLPSSRGENGAQTLREIIDASKKAIAQVAGVDESSIRISIDY